jgi:hypothetical protein
MVSRPAAPKHSSTSKLPWKPAALHLPAPRQIDPGYNFCAPQEATNEKGTKLDDEVVAEILGLGLAALFLPHPRGTPKALSNLCSPLSGRECHWTATFVSNP